MKKKYQSIQELHIAPYGVSILLSGNDRLTPVTGGAAHADARAALDTLDAPDIYDDRIELGKKQCKKSESRLSKSKAKELRAAFHALMKAPRLLPNHTTCYKFLVLCLLATVADIVTAKIPGTPIVVLEGLATIPVALHAMVDCFVPFNKMKGDGKIMRPSCLEAVVPIWAVQPSNDIISEQKARKRGSNMI